MEQIDQGRFACDKCGRSFRWKPELAGRKVKCKCAHVMTVPSEPPVAAALDEGLYELAQDEKQSATRSAAEPVGYSCPSCRGAIEPGAIVCGQCGFNLRAGGKAAKAAAAPAGAVAAVAGAPVLPYLRGLPQPKQHGEFANALGGEPWRELYLPAALVLGGLAMLCVQNMYDGASWASFSDVLPRIGLGLLFNLVISFIGVFIVSRMMETSFGAPGPAVLKLAAACLLPPALGALIGGIVGADSAFVRIMVSSMLMLPLTFLFLWKLFDLDGDEALYCTTVIWLVNQWIVIFLLSALLGGEGIGLFAPPQSTADQQVGEMLTSPRAVEAKAWLDESTNRIVGTMGRGDSVKLVDDLYAAGAIKVTVKKSGPNAEAVIIELPRDKDKRKAIFQWYTNFMKARFADAEQDAGNKYLVMDF